MPCSLPPSAVFLLTEALQSHLAVTPRRLPREKVKHHTTIQDQALIAEVYCHRGWKSEVNPSLLLKDSSEHCY